MLDTSMYAIMSKESLQKELEAAYRNAEKALERGIDRIYENSMKRIYEIEKILKGV